jgi:stearoyl-CoA desaturase (delta-9 desaturase)
MAIILFLVSHWFLSLFCQTFFLHRYAAHRMFTMSPFWERFFNVLTFLMQGSSYLNPRAYAIMHRQHHAYSDTQEDPHSPHFFPTVFQMMLNTKITYRGLLHGSIEPDARFESNLPEWKGFDWFTNLWVVRVFWGVLYSCFYFYFITDLWLLVFLPIHFMMGPIQGAIVNWCGHKYGYANFDNHDRSKNTLVWDLVLLGELYQNNHHKFPNRQNFAFRWFEFDPVYPVIKLFNLLRVIQTRPQPGI